MSSRTCLPFRLLFAGLLLWLSAWGCTGASKNQSDPAETTTNAQPSVPAETPPATIKKTVLFFGNSLTAGYGVEPSQAFSALVANRIDSLKLPYTVVNAGLSGETSAGGKGRISWVMRQPVSIFVLELGGNDGLRGIDLKSTRQNLQAIIDTVRQKSPQAKIVLAGMQIPPNLGPDYTRSFRQLYPELAKANNAVLIPFLLQDVGGIARLNQADGIHPTVEGHKVVAKTVWQTLEPLLREETALK